MKKSSKNRLTPRQQSFFSGNNLFDKIARAVCRAGTLPRKELHEAWEMAKRVWRKYRGGRILDLACGHGLLAHIMLILDDTSKTAIAVDKEIPLNAGKLSNALITSWPRLKNRVIYKEVPVQEITILPDDIVVSAHACGSLTDLIIDKAIEQHAQDIHRHDMYNFFIDAIRDLWEALLREAPDQAIKIYHCWSEIDDGIFNCMALHAARLILENSHAE